MLRTSSTQDLATCVLIKNPKHRGDLLISRSQVCGNITKAPYRSFSLRIRRCKNVGIAYRLIFKGSSFVTASLHEKQRVKSTIILPLVETDFTFRGFSTIEDTPLLAPILSLSEFNGVFSSLCNLRLLEL